MNAQIQEMIAGLKNKNPVERQRCRHQLTEAGTAAAKPLVELLNSRDDDLRWEAAKALTAIADPSSIAALIHALEDNDGRVRWDAAVGLARIGKPSVEAILHAVIDRAQAGRILEGAHHVIYELAHNDWGQFLRPVYSAFNASEPAISAPVAAEKALEQWQQKPPKSE